MSRAITSIAVVILMTTACGSPATTGDSADALTVRAMDTLSLVGIDSLGYTTMTRPTRLADGRIVAAPLTDCGRIALFDASGIFQRIVGRCGEGPGELGRINGIVATDDGRSRYSTVG